MTIKDQKAFIVGSGRLGKHIALLLMDNGVEVIGTWNRKESSALESQDQLGVPCFFGDWPNILGDATVVVVSVSVEPF